MKECEVEPAEEHLRSRRLPAPTTEAAEIGSRQGRPQPYFTTISTHRTPFEAIARTSSSRRRSQMLPMARHDRKCVAPVWRQKIPRVGDSATCVPLQLGFLSQCQYAIGLSGGAGKNIPLPLQRPRPRRLPAQFLANCLCLCVGWNLGDLHT